MSNYKKINKPPEDESRLDLTRMAQAMPSMSEGPRAPKTSSWHYVERRRGGTQRSRPASAPHTAHAASQRGQPNIGRSRGAGYYNRNQPQYNPPTISTGASATPSATPVVRVESANAAGKVEGHVMVHKGGAPAATTVEQQPPTSHFTPAGGYASAGSSAAGGSAPHRAPPAAGKPKGKKKKKHRGSRAGQFQSPKTPAITVGSQPSSSSSPTATNRAPQAPEQPQRSMKRSRNADDTASPQEERKRPKTAPSYADAAKKHLLVAVKILPSRGMTPEQSEQLADSLNQVIDGLGDLRSLGQKVFFPLFRGKPFLSEGVLKIWCEDDRTLDWLRANVNQLTSPVPNTTLAIIKQSEVTRQIKAALLLPGLKVSCTADIVRAHSVLSGQNEWCDVDSWELWAHDQREKGLFLTLGIPETDIPAIMARERRMVYRMGNTYVRFFGPNGLTDVPPTMERGQEPPPPQPMETTSAALAAPGPGITAEGSEGDLLSDIDPDVEALALASPADSRGPGHT